MEVFENTLRLGALSLTRRSKGNIWNVQQEPMTTAGAGSGLVPHAVPDCTSDTARKLGDASD